MRARYHVLGPLVTACGLIAAGCLDEGSRATLDLVPWARLAADATRPADGPPWPYESTDAIACVRDGHTGTGWKPPVGEAARVEIDLQPWLQGMARLETLGLVWEGGAPDRIALELREGCGGELRERLVAPPEAEVELALGGRRAGCLVLEVLASTPLTLTGLRLVGEVPAARVPGLDGAVAEGGTDPHSGVIEGFYGVPWSPDERRRTIAHLAHLGLGSYLYAPKDDPLHRARWREPYPEEDLAEFEALAAFAREREVRFRMGLSPFIDYDPQAGDAEALRTKLGSLVACGVAGVVLLADDIEGQVGRPIDGALGAEHVAVVNDVAAWLAGQAGEPPELWFVPTVYTDERIDMWPGGEDYLRALQGLDPAVEIMWVGPFTSTAEMEASDLARFTGLAGRTPVIWENFWANDGGDLLFGRILLGLFTGRSEDLPGAVLGIDHNPSIQGALSRLTLSAFAFWRDEPGHPYPEDARQLAALREVPFALRRDDPALAMLLEPLALAMEVFDGHARRAPAFGRLEAAVDALEAELDAGLPDPTRLQRAAVRLLDALADMRTLRSLLHHGLAAPDLVDELDFPLLRVEHDAEVGLGVLCALAAALGGEEDADCLAAAQAARAAAGNDRFLLGSGRLPALLDRALALPRGDHGFRAQALDPPPACRVGEPLQWVAESTQANQEFGARGLPGVHPQDGRVLWTAPHAGRYRSLVFAGVTDGLGWGFRQDEIVCR